MPSSTRYTLSIPPAIFNELREQADKHSQKISDVVRQCLKVGLVALKVEDDPDSQIYIRRQTEEDGEQVSQEIQLLLI